MAGFAPSLYDLGELPEQWRLKGEGNANWVFAYEGNETHLVGRVLRIRKPRPPAPPEQAALEEAVWSPVLGSAGPAGSGSSPGAALTSSSAAAAMAADVAREQRYVQRVLAPLLGEQHIPRVQAVHTSAGFLRRVLAANGRPTPAGLLGEGGEEQGLGAAAPAGAGEAAAAEAADAAVPAQLLPDLTLLLSVGAGCSQAGSSNSEIEGGEVGGSGGSSGAEGTCGELLGEGPVVCLELKPKCGFVGSCGTVHPANRPLKRHRSRYQLHQLLKLSEGKIAACSSYDPCDLFSGQRERVRRALHALLEHPQNNLRLFVDGQQAALQQSVAPPQPPSQQEAEAGQQQQEAGRQQQEAGWQHAGQRRQRQQQQAEMQQVEGRQQQEHQQQQEGQQQQQQQQHQQQQQAGQQAEGRPEQQADGQGRCQQAATLPGADSWKQQAEQQQQRARGRQQVLHQTERQAAQAEQVWQGSGAGARQASHRQMQAQEQKQEQEQGQPPYQQAGQHGWQQAGQKSAQQGQQALLPSVQQGEQQGEQREGAAGSASSADGALAGLLGLLPAREQLLGALVELVAAALEAEGVLQRLLEAQRQCQYDVEGVYCLYRQLVGAAAAAAAAGKPGGGTAAGPAAAGAVAVGAAAAAHLSATGRSSSSSSSSSSSDGGGWCTAARSGGSQGSNSGGGAGGGAEDGDDDHSAALSRLLALPPAEAHDVLRGYVVAATTKDCALMITLQRLRQRAPAESDDAGSPGSSRQGDISCPCSNGSSSGGGGGAGGCGASPASQQDTKHGQQRMARLARRQSGSEPGVLHLHQPCSGGAGGAACCTSSAATSFLYRLCFVDLDMKPLAKIPHHHDLDQRILAAARAHAQLSAGPAGTEVAAAAEHRAGPEAAIGAPGRAAEAGPAAADSEATALRVA